MIALLAVTQQITLNQLHSDMKFDLGLMVLLNTVFFFLLCVAIWMKR